MPTLFLSIGLYIASANFIFKIIPKIITESVNSIAGRII